MFSDIIVIDLINSASATLLGDLHYACSKAELDGVLKEANESFRDGAGYFQNQSVGPHYPLFTDPANIEITIHRLSCASGAVASLRCFGCCGTKSDSTGKFAAERYSRTDTKGAWRAFSGIVGSLLA